MKLMTTQDWQKCRVLRGAIGNWGDWKLMSHDLIMACDQFFFENGILPLVTSGTSGKHSKNSFHYKGQAIDFMFYRLPLEGLVTLYKRATQNPAFTGLGLYSDWRMAKHVPPTGGMHIEQDATQALPVVRKKLWVRTSDGDFAPSEEIFQKYFLTKK